MIIVPQDMERLRALRDAKASGHITAAEYLARFALVNAAVGEPCVICGRRPAAIQTAAGPLCAACAGEVMPRC